MQQKFYSLLLRKCPELKYFDMRSLKHQIFYFPEAKVRLETLCELKCDTLIDSSYFYGLSRSCQLIQKLVIFNMDPRPNNGIVKLIEVQKNLNHFEWSDSFDDEYFMNDPYKEILLALEKKAESLKYLSIVFQYVEGYDHTTLQEILPKLYKLKVLFINASFCFTEHQLKQLKMQTYNELEILYMDENELNFYSNIVENSGGHLKKILFKPYDVIDFELDHDYFNENSLNFIRKVYKTCPLIEYLSILISSTKENFSELEKLLKICQNLKSLLIVALDDDDNYTNEGFSEYGKELLKILIRSPPTNLKEIRLGREFKFSLEDLEEFLEEWKGRRALSIFIVDTIYMEDDLYIELINKYKSNGVIKDFVCLGNAHRINYCIDDLKLS
ncbi:unnamed protein product [Rhizophagus irregularis]|nr:unnamed protein product [Rhizophagus irregularis]